MVDTRPAAEFLKCHIPGALNLQVREVRTKAYLRDETILLVSDGYRRLELRDACAMLRAAGFHSVRVLDGGLTAWVDAGGALWGERRPGDLEVPSQAFDAEVRRGDWVVIDVSEQLDPEASQLIAAAHHIPFSARDKDFPQRLAATLRAQGEQNEDAFALLAFRKYREGHGLVLARGPPPCSGCGKR